MAGPLNELLVLDLGFVGVGPIACSWLAMLGARVIKIESPAGDPAIQVSPPALQGRSVAYMAYNQGKEGIILDLKDTTDRDIFNNMVARADLLVINWRPGQPERLGIGYEQLRPLNERLIYISCPGYGHRGPYKDLPSYDPWGANLSGFTSLNGPAGSCGELDRGPLACDLTTSATVLQGALIALYHRARTGKGQKVETSQLQAATSLIQTRAAEYLVGGRAPRAGGSATATVVPSQAFTASDGWVAISAENEAQWLSLCEVLDHPELAGDRRFRTNTLRVQNREDLIPILSAAIRTQPVKQWVYLCQQRDVPASAYNHLRHTRFDCYVQGEGKVVRHKVDGGSIDVGGAPWRFGRYGSIPGRPLLEPGMDSLRLAQEFGAARDYSPKPWRGKPEGSFF